MIKNRLRRMVKPVKKHLIKKAIANKYYLENEYLVYEIKLINFWLSPKSMRAKFIHGDIELNLFVDNNGTLLFVRVPVHELRSINEVAYIELTIDNKLVWITKSTRWDNFCESILIEKKYITTNIYKSIIIANHFKELTFIPEKVRVTVPTTKYNSLVLSLQDSDVFTDLDSLEVYAFNHDKFIILNGIRDAASADIVITEFSPLLIGLWRLFFKINDAFYPLEIVNDYHRSFDTYNHEVSLLTKGDCFYLHAEPHLFLHGSIAINMFEDEQLQLAIKSYDKRADTNFELILDELATSDVKNYPLTKTMDSLITKIALNDLCTTFFSKQFFIVDDSAEPKKYQFDLQKHHLSSALTTYKITCDSQVITLKFYKQKDHSLGLKVTKPVIRRMIVGINDFKIKGFVLLLNRFIQCQAFLLLEERDSGASIKVPIHNRFSVDLMKLDLVQLKSKDKTIIDFYIVVENSESQVIRKEKIAYRHADYKKDTYYEYQMIEDADQNEHHFLLTTTPFDNLKIESFTILNDIQLPLNVKKDDNVWLIGERYNTAQDNGIVFFNWLRENTSVEAYYVIEENNADFELIRDNPYVVAFGTQKHFNVSLKAKVLLGTHDLENILPYKAAGGFFGYEETYKVFLQHGVLGRKNVEYHKKYYDLPFDLFIVSSEAEKSDIVVGEMGYDKEDVVVTGLARFDQLVTSVAPKDILLMPTWRDWINTDARFLESDYYTAYSKLIKNKKLLQLLDDYEVNLNFYPHYRAQDYFVHESEYLHDRIKFIPFGSETVQNLLLRHALLLTDYSSVSFDFSLLKKPVIYFHFDVDRFFRRGILRPIEETFIGGIATTGDEMVELIRERIKHQLSNYDYDISGIIKYDDLSNCERIYRHVQKLFIHGQKE
ncbi:CDP-glycerol glycerophosphotransferase family protein [Sporosarcina sp. G11-34]|uniref:CDP-glycerol glycerophosphotransferase family protein n=1 Tax=Sporosarcina sp. G11-34 TaxID=2849605 RepID=UPI0022A8ECDC|nr:CDP-glycerol glycerophosphotransferase family protein [Sporosarcina sp. G11-34]MCZ2258661.1 CDP-glycerol glycerophosphotransferase family protein [Sporosarcina sp. G11-34]